jgi:hypothetical protein
VECLATGGWWLHLRRCAECGHIGCCDSSPAQHASQHAKASGHPVIASFEPGEDWFYDYEEEAMIPGAELAPPRSHPVDQPRVRRSQRGSMEIDPHELKMANHSSALVVLPHGA